MSKFQVAYRLADELGTTTDEALQMVDEVGESSAKKWLAGGALAGAGGGGFLLSDHLNDKSDEAELAKYETLQDLLSDDSLSSEERASYIDRITNQPDPEDDSDSGLDITSMVMEDPAKVVIILVIVLAVLNNGMDNVMGDD